MKLESAPDSEWRWYINSNAMLPRQPEFLFHKQIAMYLLSLIHINISPMVRLYLCAVFSRWVRLPVCKSPKDVRRLITSKRRWNKRKVSRQPWRVQWALAVSLIFFHFGKTFWNCRERRRSVCLIIPTNRWRWNRFAGESVQR